ncbi:MAG TPA: cysteine peptidase family C39 domain-containing protein, partial [Mycobacterium sp.]
MPAALAMALGYHGRHVSLAEMHEATGTGRDGTNALQIAEAAAAYGLRARGGHRARRSAGTTPRHRIALGRSAFRG